MSGPLHMEVVDVGETILGFDLHINRVRSIPSRATGSWCGKRLVKVHSVMIMVDLEAESYGTINGKKVRKVELTVEKRHVCNKCFDLWKRARRGESHGREG